jgi:spermidine/putrescine transport system substrate-binding protein
MQSRIPPSPTPVTRRALLRGAAWTGLASPAVIHSKRAEAASSVSIMAYAGLVPPAFKSQFEQETGIEVRVRPMFSQAPELNLLIAERPHPTSDICTVGGHRLHQFVDAAVIEPVDALRLKNWGRIDPLYTNAAWLRVSGDILGVPLTLSCERLVYNTQKVSSAPDSWGVMFDPKFRGKTTYVIEDFLQCTMLYQGTDGGFASYVDQPEKARKAVDAARDLLIANKSQVLKYYEDGAKLVQLLAGEDAYLAQFYSGAPTKLVLDGQPFRFVLPREGSLGSVYTLGVVKDAPNRDNAYRFLDALLAYPGVGAAMTRASGYPSTFLGADASLSELEKQAFLLTPQDLQRIQIPRYEGRL